MGGEGASVGWRWGVRRGGGEGERKGGKGEGKGERGVGRG